MKLTPPAALLLSLLLTACSTSKMSQDGTQQQLLDQHQHYAELTRQYAQHSAWWKDYRDPQLDALIEQALRQNVDLAKATIALNRAYYNARLLGANLVPTFSGSGSQSASKGIGSTDNLHATGTSNLAAQLGFNLSYTLDLWGRLKDSASAAEWEHQASQQDREATRLSLINGVIGLYYNLAYYQDAIRLTQRSLARYTEIHRIMQRKLEQGQVDQLSVEQSRQAVLSTENSLINLQGAQKGAEQTLRNLLNLTPDKPLGLTLPRINDVSLQGVAMDVPVSVIAHRPDVLAALHRLQSAFHNLQSMENSWFPTITLGGSLSGNARHLHDLGDTPLGAGLLSFNLPFLDWSRVKNNIHLSEEGYKLAKLNYEQTMTSALNEIARYYDVYQQTQHSLDKLRQKQENDQKISRYYQNRYEQGVAELRDWLNALNTAQASELATLEGKYTLLRHENAVYQAMAGKYRR